MESLIRTGRSARQLSRPISLRWLWRACVLLVGLLGLNCQDGTGPGLRAGSLALVPSFEPTVSQIEFDRMRVTLTHADDGEVVRGPVLDTVIVIPATAETIDVSLTVPLTSSREEMLLYLRLVNAIGDTVFRNDPYPQPVTVTAGGTAAPVLVTIRATVSAIVVTPVETVLASLGETQQFSAVGLDENGDPLPTQPTFVWGSSAPAVASVDPGSGLVVAVANGTATITATASGVSGGVTVVVSQVATQIVFTTHPTTALAGSVITPAVAVAVQDARGNAVAGLADIVTIAIGTNPSAGTLAGTTAQTAVNGVVQFGDLSIDQPGNQYTLVATVSGLPPIISLPFDVRPAPASVYWSNPTGGVWSNPANWSTGAVPSGVDHAVIALAGTYTVTLDVDATFTGLTLGGSSGTQTLLVQSHRLTLNGAGTITANGILQVSSGYLAGTGPLTNSGRLQLYYGTIESPLALRNEAFLSGRGSSYINGPLTTGTGSTFRVEGDAFCCASYAYVADGFTNNGTIDLTAINGTGTTAALGVTAGTLVNGTGATINALAGAGGTRQLDLELDNRGTVTIDAPTTMNRGASNSVNSGTLNLSGGNLALYQYAFPTQGSFTNTGVMTVAAAETLKVTYGEFRHNSGSLSGAGVLVIESGTLVLGQNLSNAVTGLVLNSATVNGPGTLVNSAGKSLVSYYSTINAPLSNQGVLTLRGSSTMNGAVTTAAGSTLRVEGDAFCCGAFATIEDGFTNNGTIELTAINATGTSAVLNVTNGTLVNAAGASINALPGAGGNRELNVELNNQGTVTIGAPTAMNRGASNHANSGTVDIGGGNLLLYQYAFPSQGSFTNTGNMTVAAAETLKVQYGDFRYNAGTLDGSGTIRFEYGTLTLGQGFSNAVTTLALSQATVHGPGMLTNAAARTLVAYQSTVNAPLDNRGLLKLRGTTTINGALTTAAGSTLLLEGDAFCCQSYATVLGGFTNNGTIGFTAINTGGTLTRLGVTNGTLVNAAGASIDLLPGTGGSRQLDVELDNRGTVNVDAPTTMGRGASNHANSGTINVSSGNLWIYQFDSPTPGSFTNTGAVNVATAETLRVQYGRFVYNSGTLGGSGTVFFEFATFILGQGFSNAVPTLALSSATVEGPGTLTNAAGRTLVAYQSQLNAPLDNQGLLKLRGFTNINGALTTASGSTLVLEGDAFCCQSFATVLNGFTNNGTIDLTAINSPGTTARLGVTNGTLVNASGASILLSAGAGGIRQLDVELDNRGSVTVGAQSQMNRGGSVHQNSGTIDLSGGSLTIYQYLFPTAGTFTNTGTVTVAAAETLKVQYGDFNHSGGGLGGAGALELSNVAAGNFNVAHSLAGLRLSGSTASFATDQSTAATEFSIYNSTVNGPGALINAAAKTLLLDYATINAPLSNQGLLTLRGSSNVTGALTTATGSTLRVEGDPFYASAFAAVTSGFTNNGTIELTAVNGPATAFLAVPNGTLVNAAGASINSVVGTGGARTLNAALNNLGILRVEQPLTMGRASSIHTNTGTIDVRGDLTLNQSGTAPSFVNSGGITIDVGRTWTVNGGAWTHQDPGTLSGNALVLNSVTSAAFVSPHSLGAITLNGTTASFALNQNTDVTAFDLTNSTVDGPGSFTNVAGRTLVMNGGKMNAAFDNSGLFTLRASNTQVNGPLTTSATSVVRVEGDASFSSAFVTILNGFANNGRLELTSIKGSATAHIGVTNGELLNNGTIDISAGTGGSRAFDVMLNNQGAMTVGAATTMSKGDAGHTNGGTITVGGGNLTVNQSGGNPNFANSGLIEIAKALTLRITSGNVTNARTGKIQGEGTFDIRPPVTFSSDGELIPGFSAGILSIAGDPLLQTNSVVRVELGGPVLGTEYDQLLVTPTTKVTLAGNLDVRLINGYDPTGQGVTFTVVTGANGGTRFESATVPPQCNQPIYTPTAVQIFCP